MPRYSSQRRTFIALSAAGALSLALAGCKSEPKFQGTDISGTHLGRDMAMVDSSGQVRTLADYKGKVVVVFFGFTHCPDVCPTAMAELAQTMQLLKDDAKKVQVVMISVDPERDTGALMGAYVKAFYPTFVGLTGSDEQLHKTAQSFKAYYAKAPGKTPGEYDMNHSSSFYILDQKGEARVLLNGNAPAKVIAGDIRQLL
ncbi:SCO family protein [Paralcaligenes sp. KSB-10]|uniref:SCO family protein n=1 Tax=Paralcaligenes sp. KSB-10 TaxID=2901142 RepID=UPI001E318E57|nr:SCO family protein [Paralcaligenes sp. KSB-10]UHL63786.1 SCO family protein [Paralcaligenes sp. KSB-10]